MKNSTKAEALKTKLVKLTDAQINGVLLNVSEYIGTANIDYLIDDLFWDSKWHSMSDSELLTEANRLADWFGSIWYTQADFTKAVNSYFERNSQPDNQYV